MRYSQDHRSCGFFIFEMIVGLGLLVLAALVLIRATSRVHLASSTMADGRQATRAAEAALSRLQAGQPMSGQDLDAQIRITPAAGSKDIGSSRWVDVTAMVRGQTRTLTGLVPRTLPQTAPAPGGSP